MRALESAPARMPPRPAAAAVADPEPVLEGVVLDPVAARKAARDQRYRESPDGIMFQSLSSR